MEIVQTQELFELTAGDLRLTFVKRHDRWQHAVFARHEDQSSWSMLCQSVEGTADQSVPASPALQDCFVQEIGAGIQELQLLGQSGTNVYSAAVRFYGERREIDFDLCLRTTGTAGAPAILSTYCLPGGLDASTVANVSGGTCKIAWDFATRLEIELLPTDATETRRGELRIDRSSHRLEIPGDVATEASSRSARRSFRWHYRLRLIGSA